MGELPEGVTHWDGPPLEAWEAWTPQQAAARLARAGVPWCVVGGWAVDLFLGEVTREHDDLEIAIQRSHLGAVRAALEGLPFHAVGDGEVRRLQPYEATPPDKHQNWVLDVDADRWRMDVMLEPGDASTWVYRRDERVRAPREFMVAETVDGVPYLLPHGTLLYKAKSVRPKDGADFAQCLPRLDGEARVWLIEVLRDQHPTHAWIAALEGRDSS